MTDNAEVETDEKKPRSKASLVLWALMACASIGGGFATPFVVEHFRADADEDQSTASSTDDSEPPSLIEFGEVTVNLNESRLNRYLRLNISLLVSQPDKLDVEKSLLENQPILQSWLLSYLADKAMEDIRGATGQNRLRREIQTHFNAVMFPGSPPKIRNILFQEFNIQ